MRVEQERLEEERRRIATAQNELDIKAQEVQNASQKAEQLHMRSQQTLEEAHYRQLELSKQTVEINRQQEQVKEKEMSLAKVSFIIMPKKCCHFFSQVGIYFFF